MVTSQFKLSADLIRERRIRKMRGKPEASEEKVEDKIERPQRIRRPKSGSSRDLLGINREEQERIYALSTVTRLSSG
jgi:hypothetical protein